MLAVIFWGVVFELFAQQPQINVMMDNSLEITHPYSDMVMLSDGNLQYYNMVLYNGSIQVTGFQYSSQSNSLTETIQLGNITGIPGEIQRGFVEQRFGYFYAVYQFTGSEPQGLVIMRLDGNEFMYRLIDNLQSGISDDLKQRMDFVNENVAVIALDDSLIYYNIHEGSSQTLLEGEVYQCDYPLGKRVYAMPDGHFAYIKDSRGGGSDVWVIFDSLGNYQFTEVMTDQLFSISYPENSCDQNYSMVNDRFYITNSVITFSSFILECYFPTPDSLHYYIVSPPGSLEEINTGYISFGNDRILRSYFDNGYDEEYIYVNNSPLELNPEPSHWGYLGSTIPCMDNLSDNIVAVLARLEESIRINVFCTLDFPTVHNFTFPSPPYHATLPGYTFTHENKLFLISGGVIYSFHVDYTLPNADEAVAPPIPSLSAYPNPVKRSDGITFQAANKKPMEVEIYNIRGQKVKTICLRSDGNTQWDLRNDKGESVSAGIYFAKPRQEQDSKPVKFVVMH